MEVAGRWRKLSRSECSAPYPDVLELEPGGRYTGWNETPSAFHPLWDRGGWEAAEPGLLRISLANDAVREYAVELDGDYLVFDDGETCRIEYVRA